MAATASQSQDPFAAQRTENDNPFLTEPAGDLSGSPPTGSSPTRDKRLSKEWDASKVPPSRFQKREGSIYSTPSSRDAHVKGPDRDKSFHDKLKEKGWVK